MPIFEYICEECGEVFEMLVMSASATKEVHCPNCMSDLVRKLISTFSAKVGGKSGSYRSSAPASSCGTRST